MAASFPESRAAVALALVFMTPPSSAALTAAQGPITLEAGPTEIDWGNNVMIYHKVKIAQGGMSVAADLAQANGTTLDFENSRWLFRGNVKIIIDQGQLTADEADITFARKLLVKVVIHGKQAAFEQRNTKLGKLVQGRSDDIDYDVTKNLVLLSGNAWLSDGANEIRGECLKYQILERKMQTECGDQNSQRVRITITPPQTMPPAAPPAGTKP